MSNKLKIIVSIVFVLLIIGILSLIFIIKNDKDNTSKNENKTKRSISIFEGYKKVSEKDMKNFSIKETNTTQDDRHTTVNGELISDKSDYKKIVLTITYYDTNGKFSGKTSKSYDNVKKGDKIEYKLVTVNDFVTKDYKITVDYVK